MKKPELIKDLGMIEYGTQGRTIRYGLYLCDCGKEFKSQVGHIKNGSTSSCGCNKHKALLTHKYSSHRLYGTWYAMMQRVKSKNPKVYKSYGARGIDVCKRWLSVENFIQDMFPTFKEGLTLDRIKNDGDYEPSNCRWASYETQARNTRLIRATNKSGYRGVRFFKRTKQWTAQITVCRKYIHLGYFSYAHEAAKAYDKYVIDNKLEHPINGFSELEEMV